MLYHKKFKTSIKSWISIEKSGKKLNIELKKKKSDFEKSLFKLINNLVFGKIMENVRKHRDIKPVRNKAKRNYLVSEQNYHTAKSFSENLVTIERKKHKY